MGSPVTACRSNFFSSPPLPAAHSFGTAPIEKLQHQMDSEGELSTAMPLQSCEVQSIALKRFTKNCKVDAVFDEDGILLGEIASTSMDIELQKMVADTCKKMEEMLTQAKQSLAGVQFFRDGIFALADELNKIVPAKKQTTAQEFEEFLGCTIPNEVSIHPPNDIRSRGKIKRIKGHSDKGAKQSNQGKKNKENASQLCEIQAS